MHQQAFLEFSDQKNISNQASHAHILKLREELKHHDVLYYDQATPEISDRQYDQLYRELLDYEKKYPEVLTNDSPTQRVKEHSQGFQSAAHLAPMQSLDNTYSEKEVIEFITRLQKLLPTKKIELTIEPKIDGVAISLLYEEGKLVRALTRGDGTMGDDVTENIQTIDTIPRSLKGNFPKKIELRGEIYLPKNRFLQLNEERDEQGLPAFANPRNAAAGSLKQLDPAVVKTRGLAGIFYGYGIYEGVKPETQIDFIEQLHSWEIPTNPKIWKANSTNEVLQAIHELGTLRHTYPFETDGAVLKINTLAHRERLGSTSKAPRWAIAFKYEPEQAITRLLSITVQVGRTGVLTPVAELESVLLAGSRVARATLHNEEEILRKDLRLGDYVVIEKAGEVIPAVVKVVKEKRNGTEKLFQMPQHCPACNTAALKKENEVALRCINPDCSAQVQRRIEYFASRGAMDITGLGEAVVAQLIKAQLLHDAADLYTLSDKQLLPLERMGEKSIQNLLQSIDQSRQQPLWRLLVALGIPHIGTTAAHTLAERFHTLEKITTASVEELCAIEEIGAIMAESIHKSLEEPAMKILLEKLKTAGINFGEKDPIVIASNGPLQGTTWVLTGSLSQSRDFIIEKIRHAGGKVSSSISAKTTYLLAGEAAGSKLERALKLKVRVLNETEFQQML